MDLKTRKIILKDRARYDTPVCRPPAVFKTARERDEVGISAESVFHGTMQVNVHGLSRKFVCNGTLLCKNVRERTVVDQNTFSVNDEQLLWDDFSVPSKTH